MTKAEFLDQLAGDERVGSKKAAGDAVDAVLDAITDTLSGGGEVSFTGFGKFHVAERGPAPGRQPAHRRADHDSGRQGPALLRRLGAEDQGQGRLIDLTPFADRLAALVEERRSQVCLGLDPDPAKLGRERARCGRRRCAGRRAGGRAAVAAHCRSLIERAGPGLRRGQAAARLLRAARGTRAGRRSPRSAGRLARPGLLVVADGKRGDVPVTAAAYAQALVGETPTPWGPVAGLGADAFTANPLLGGDALEPLVAAAEAAGAGVFALVRTSNPGAADLQDLPAPERAAARAARRAGRRALRAARRASGA